MLYWDPSLTHYVCVCVFKQFLKGRITMCSLSPNRWRFWACLSAERRFRAAGFIVQSAHTQSRFWPYPHAEPSPHTHSWYGPYPHAETSPHTHTWYGPYPEQCFPYRYIRGAPRPHNGTPRPSWKVKFILFNFVFYKAPDHNGSHLRLPFL